MSTVHWLALSAVPGIGGVTARRLLERFGSIEAVFAAPAQALAEVPRVTPEMAAQLRALPLEVVEAELDELAAEGLAALTWDDAGYPANLRDLADAPPLLFLRGELVEGDAEAVAIVGSRAATPAGLAVAQTLARELAGRGLTVVSGLAQGIDEAAHRGALEARGGRTLAVPGSGLRAIGPRSSRALAEAIERQGALLSELHPDAPPRGPQLMARDRILSGLSRAVVVVEAAERSGSLDTAARALRQGRLLLAVAGSPGTDGLLAAGAEVLVPQAADLDELCARIRGHQPGQEPAQPRLW